MHRSILTTKMSILTEAIRSPNISALPRKNSANVRLFGISELLNLDFRTISMFFSLQLFFFVLFHNSYCWYICTTWADILSYLYCIVNNRKSWPLNMHVRTPTVPLIHDLCIAIWFKRQVTTKVSSTYRLRPYLDQTKGQSSLGWRSYLRLTKDTKEIAV